MAPRRPRESDGRDERPSVPGRILAELRRHSVSALALFLVLGGSAYAAVTLGPGSVGSREIANHSVQTEDLAPHAVTMMKIEPNAVTASRIAPDAVNSDDVEDGSLIAADFHRGVLLQGPAGERGPRGLTGLRGAKGETGDQGPKGDTGDQGPKGDTGDQGPKGDTGDQGPPGVSNYQIVTNNLTNQSLAAGGETIQTASCAVGKRLLGGGGLVRGASGRWLVGSSGPASNTADPDPTTWTVAWENTSGSTITAANQEVYAICATVG